MCVRGVRSRGIAKVAEYRAIFGGAAADRIPIGCTPDENPFTSIVNGEMGV